MKSLFLTNGNETEIRDESKVFGLRGRLIDFKLSLLMADVSKENGAYRSGGLA